MTRIHSCTNRKQLRHAEMVPCANAWDACNGFYLWRGRRSRDVRLGSLRPLAHWHQCHGGHSMTQALCYPSWQIGFSWGYHEKLSPLTLIQPNDMQVYAPTKLIHWLQLNHDQYQTWSSNSVIIAKWRASRLRCEPAAFGDPYRDNCHL